MPRKNGQNKSRKNLKTLYQGKHENEQLTANAHDRPEFFCSQDEFSKVFCETLNDCLHSQEKSGICSRILTGAKSFCSSLWAKKEAFDVKKEIKSILDKFHNHDTSAIHHQKKKKNKKAPYNKTCIEYINNETCEQEKKNWLIHCNKLDCIQTFLSLLNTKRRQYSIGRVTQKMEKYCFYTKLYDKIITLEKKHFDAHYADNSGFALRYAYKTSSFLSGTSFSYIFNTGIILCLGASTCLRASGYEEDKEWNKYLNLLEQVTTVFTLFSLIGQMTCNSVKIFRDCNNTMTIFKHTYECINMDSAFMRNKKIKIYDNQIQSIYDSKVAKTICLKSIISSVMMRGIIVNGSSAIINVVPSDQNITSTLVGLMRLTTSVCMFFSTGIEFSVNLQFLHFAQNLVNLRNTIDGLSNESEIKSFQCLNFDLYKSLVLSDNKKRSRFIGNSLAYFFASSSTIASTAILIGVASTVDAACQNISPNATSHLLMDNADPQSLFDPFLSHTMNCTNNINFVANFVEGFNPLSVLSMDCGTTFTKFVTIFFLTLTSTGASNVIIKDLLKENLVSPIFSADVMRFSCTLASYLVIPIGRLDSVKEFFGALDKSITPGTVTLSVALDAIGTIFTITKVLASGNNLITDLKLTLPSPDSNHETDVAINMDHITTDSEDNVVTNKFRDVVKMGDGNSDNKSIYDNSDNIMLDVITTPPSCNDVSDSNVEHDTDLLPRGNMLDPKVVVVSNKYNVTCTAELKQNVCC